MNDQRLYHVLLAPHISEKTATAAEMEGRHTFKVAPTATKLEVRKAVEKLFDVSVRSVRSLMFAAKPSGLVLAKVNVQIGKRQSFDWLKARTSTSWE